MDKKNGFSLILFLLYLFLFSSITVCICTIFTSLVLPTITNTRQCRSLMALHIASDLFFNDIQQAKKSSIVWQKTTDNEIIWSNKDVSIGWKIDKNTLKRKEGIYSLEKWKKATTCVIADRMEYGKFRIEKHNGIIMALSCSLAITQDKIVECYVALVPISSS